MPIKNLSLTTRPHGRKEGETRKAHELGYVSSARYIWVKCPSCYFYRWVILSSRKSPHYTGYCIHCNRPTLKRGLSRLIPITCKSCGKRFQTTAKQLEKPTYTRLCPSCLGKTRKGSKHPMWKGGRQLTKGYIQVKLEPSDPFFVMANRRGYVFEHRLIMARHLGRHLECWEIVHHKDKNPGNNSFLNLEILPNQTAHLPSIRTTQQLKKAEEEIANLKQRVLCLEANNILLKKEKENVTDSGIK